MPTVRALSKLHLNSSVIFESDLTEFPETPTSGEIVLKDGILWIYSLIEGVQTWYPLTNYRDSFVHTQALENLTATLGTKASKTDVDSAIAALEADIATNAEQKVDKVAGKGLSTNDLTNELKTKLDGVEANANKFSLPAGANGW